MTWVILFSGVALLAWLFSWLFWVVGLAALCWLSFKIASIM
jgi:hypothetical protein